MLALCQEVESNSLALYFVMVLISWSKEYGRSDMDWVL
jgi:hypothetical protein